MKAKLIRIGNSRGVRFPKPLLEEANLKDEVVLLVRDHSIVVSAPHRPREGWGDAARSLSRDQRPGLLDAETRTRFDEEEWKW
jgi:antitoxin MazE